MRTNSKPIRAILLTALLAGPTWCSQPGWTAYAQPGSASPVITMERAPLETPQGMGIYETRALKARPEVLESLMRTRGLSLTTTNHGTMVLYREALRPNLAPLTHTIVDNQKGHMLMFPNAAAAAKVTPKLLAEANAFKAAEEFVSRNELIPRDESQFTPHKLVTWSKTELTANRTSKTTDVMQTVVFQRTLGAKPMLGQGSQLTINLGHSGQVMGLNRTWNQVVKSAVAPEFRSTAEVYDAIESTVKTRLAGASHVEVKKPHLIYYGNDRTHVIPAYFFTAVIASPGVAQKSFFAGVVPAIKNPPPESIMAPAPRTETPTEARQGMRTPRLQDKSVAPPGDPTVGRYVVHDDSWDWVDDANEFKSGLISGHPGSFPAITFGDYYWDQPYFWTTSANSFVNKWNITLMEGHGNTWLFTCKHNNADIVNLNASSQPGYGNLSGSSMRFLILKGCAIIPAPPDRSDWPAPWWRIFKGLRQAVGFRTEMYIDDDISSQFGSWLAQNCQVIDSLFCATDNCSSYQWERFWGSWGDQIYGYGCAVSIPGDDYDGIYSTAAAPPATSVGLNIWWQH